MKNAELIKLFINGRKEGSGSNLFIDKNRLINYRTCIAYRQNNGIILLNGHRYSCTTSRHQNIIRKNKHISYIEFKTEEDFYNAINEYEKKSNKYLKFISSDKTIKIKDSKDCVRIIMDEYKKINKNLDYDENLDLFIKDIQITGLDIRETAYIYGTIYSNVNDEEVLRFIRDPEDGKYCDEEFLKIFL